MVDGGRTRGGGQWMSTFEYRADMRDLALDGRHWRAQFGGSSSPTGQKTGGYVLCGPFMYVVFRFLMFATVGTIIGVELGRDDGITLKWFLYVEHWNLLVATTYFGLAFCLTAFSVFTAGKETFAPPLVVLICWICYGILIPASLACALMWVFVTQKNGQWIAQPHDTEQTGILSTVVVWALAWIDLFVNRQPYYASFHGLCGVIFCWGYIIFNVVYTEAFNGTDVNGNHFVYRQLNWRQYTSAGKVAMFQLFVILPYFNALYWAVVWARRRARVAAKHNPV